MHKLTLPQKNKFGFFEVRLESIGGLGANVAGKILAEAGVMGMGYNGSNFASYGSEKKGTPVSSFVRFCDAEKPVRINSPVTDPHLLGVFHENLAVRLPITAGVSTFSTVVINTGKDPAAAREYLCLCGGKVGTIDAIRIAFEEKVRINTIMLGAITRAIEFISKEAVKAAIESTLGKKYEKQLEANLRGFDAGFEQIQFGEFEDDGRFPFIAFKESRGDLGYMNAPIGGLVIEPGSMAVKNNQSSRQGKIPLFHLGRCIHCGLCETTCPDYCFRFEPKEEEKTQKVLVFNTGLDYQYCKGCLRCVDVCPVEALTEELEAEHDIHKITARL